MYTFYDYYNNEVKLSFTYHPFSAYPKHVWIIARYQGQWLLTNHKDRGLEFPGGKVEKGETPDEAAVREVREETGGIVEDLTYIGQYFVDGKAGRIIKNIYFANISDLAKQTNYFETKGPVVLDRLPRSIEKNSSYSFMMKDKVLPHSLKYIEKAQLL